MAARSYKGLIKLVISVAMLAFVLSFTDFEKLKATISSIPVWGLLLCMFGYTVGPLLNCLRWMILARSGGIETTYGRALRAYFIGAFVNCFGLGTVGGDLTRGLLIAGKQPRKTAAMASVVADRLHGLAVLALVGSISAILLGHEMMQWPLLLTLSAIGPVVIAGWLFGPWFLMKFFSKNSSLRSKAEQVSMVFPKDPGTIAFITCISIVFHLFQISLHWVMGIILGVSVPWSYLLVVVPFVNILSSLPISWNGLGVRENAYVFFFSPVVLTKEQAVAFGAIWLLSVTTASAVGGILSVLTPELAEIRKQASPKETA